MPMIEKQTINQEDLENSLQKKFIGVSDFTIREINDYKIFFISSLVNKENVNRFILQPVIEKNLNEAVGFPVADMEKGASLTDAEEKLLRGSIIISKREDSYFVSIKLPSDTGRQIESSDQEVTIYTSLESFTEQRVIQKQNSPSAGRRFIRYG